jgi:hypothetical protein
LCLIADLSRMNSSSDNDRSPRKKRMEQRKGPRNVF